MAIGLSITSYIALLFNTYYTAKLTHISQWQQCKDIAPIWLAVILSATLAYVVGLAWQTQPLLQIMVNLGVALLCYLLYLFLAEKPLMLQLRTILHH